MTKTYILTQNKNNASFFLYGKRGNQVQYNFTGGSVTSNIPASLVLSNEYCQQLLEESELFLGGVVKLQSVSETAPKTRKVTLKPIKGISSVTDAVTYCADNFEEVVKNAKQAKACAVRHGYDFVDLKEGK